MDMWTRASEMYGCVCVLLPSSPSHNSLSGMDFPVAFRLALAFSNIGLDGFWSRPKEEEED